MSRLFILSLSFFLSSFFFIVLLFSLSSSCVPFPLSLSLASLSMFSFILCLDIPLSFRPHPSRLPLSRSVFVLFSCFIHRSLSSHFLILLFSPFFLLLLML